MGEVVREIVTAVAAAEGIAPDELDYALQEHVYVDAIDALASHPDSSWTLSFDIPRHSVTVADNGVVLVDGERFEQELSA